PRLRPAARAADAPARPVRPGRGNLCRGRDGRDPCAAGGARDPRYHRARPRPLDAPRPPGRSPLRRRERGSRGGGVAALGGARRRRRAGRDARVPRGVGRPLAVLESCRLRHGHPMMSDGMSATPRYVLKPDPHSSHSVILKWLGEGRGRRILDVGAADGIVSRRLTERGWRVTGLEGDPALAQAGARHCERMLTANLNREIPEVAGPFDAILYGDVLEHLVDPLRVLVELDRALVPDGFVMISVPNIAHLYIRLLLLVGRFDYIDRGI